MQVVGAIESLSTRTWMTMIKQDEPAMSPLEDAQSESRWSQLDVSTSLNRLRMTKVKSPLARRYLIRGSKGILEAPATIKEVQTPRRLRGTVTWACSKTIEYQHKIIISQADISHQVRVDLIQIHQAKCLVPVKQMPDVPAEGTGHNKINSSSQLLVDLLLRDLLLMLMMLTLKT